MSRPILKWVLERVLLDLASTAAPISPYKWSYGVLMLIALGSMVGGILLFSLSVGISTLFAELVYLGLSPVISLLVVVIVASMIAGGTAYAASTLIKNAVPKKPKILQPLGRLVEDVGDATVSIVTSFIQGFNEPKRRRVRIELKGDLYHAATIIPLRRRKY